MVSSLTFTTLRAISKYNSFMIFFKEQGLTFHANCLHEMPKPVFWIKSEKKMNLSSVDFFTLTVQLACIIIISVNI